MKKTTLQDFELLKVLGKGNFGKVFLVQKQDTGEMYALKTIKKREMKNSSQLSHTLSERNILTSISHQFIVTLFYAFQSPQKLYFVFEYCPGGALRVHLQRCSQFPIPLAQYYAACVLQAIEHLHSRDIVHREYFLFSIKPENVLLDARGQAKLSDFGLSKEQVVDGTSAHSFCGTPDYLAPEMIMKTGHGKPVDIWALGCLIYEMIAGRAPFKASSPDKVYNVILSKSLQFPKTFDPVAKHLVSALLNKSSERRINATQAKNHPWFASIDWSRLHTVQPPPMPPADLADLGERSPDDRSPCFRVEGFSYTRSPPSGVLKTA